MSKERDAEIRDLLNTLDEQEAIIIIICSPNPEEVPNRLWYSVPDAPADDESQLDAVSERLQEVLLEIEDGEIEDGNGEPLIAVEEQARPLKALTLADPEPSDYERKVH